MLKGPDTSSYQGDIDYSKLKVDFILCKATEGVGFRDPKLTRNQTEARKARVPLGYYHFCRPDLGNTAEAEADYFLNQVGSLKEGEMLFLDFEVTFANRVVWCKRWLDRVYQQIRVRPLIYLNQSLLHGANWKSLVDANYGLWLAVYDYDPNSQNLPSSAPWPFMAFRQYSNKEKYTGIQSQAVDGNVFYGDLSALQAYGYHDVSVPIPPPDCEDKLKKLTDDYISLKAKFDSLTQSFEKYKKDTVDEIKSLTKQRDDVAQANADLTAQIGVMAGQVETAIEERDKLKAEIAPLKSENQILSGENKKLKDDNDELNAKLNKGLKGYTKRELIRAFFGFY